MYGVQDKSNDVLAEYVELFKKLVDLTVVCPRCGQVGKLSTVTVKHKSTVYRYVVVRHDAKKTSHAVDAFFVLKVLCSKSEEVIRKIKEMVDAVNTCGR